jgi:hypothetical protein
MYLAVLAVIAGQELLPCRFVLLAYGAAVAATVAAFVHWYEEPTLTRRHGTVYEKYRQTVPAWLPGSDPPVQSQPAKLRLTASRVGRDGLPTRDKPHCQVTVIFGFGGGLVA